MLVLETELRLLGVIVDTVTHRATSSAPRERFEAVNGCDTTWNMAAETFKAHVGGARHLPLFASDSFPGLSSCALLLEVKLEKGRAQNNLVRQCCGGGRDSSGFPEATGNESHQR